WGTSPSLTSRQSGDGMFKTQQTTLKAVEQAKAPARRNQLSGYAFAYFLILPTLILIGVIIVYPIIEALLLSFSNKTFINPNPSFIGLDNYTTILNSSAFKDIVVNSLIWTVSVVVLQFVVGLGTA